VVHLLSPSRNSLANVEAGAPNRPTPSGKWGGDTAIVHLVQSLRMRAVIRQRPHPSAWRDAQSSRGAHLPFSLLAKQPRFPPCRTQGAFRMSRGALHFRKRVGGMAHWPKCVESSDRRGRLPNNSTFTSRCGQYLGVHTGETALVWMDRTNSMKLLSQYWGHTVA
jgi:hypothetical protein